MDSKDVLQAVIADKQTANSTGLGWVRKWSASRNKTANPYVIEITL
jgi:hypothetical protein